MKAKPQDMILMAANIFASTFDFLEDIEQGESPLKAAQVAFKRGKKRHKAMKHAVNETIGLVSDGFKIRSRCACGSGVTAKHCHGIKGVPEASRIFVLCACGCGLPDGQCQGRSAGGVKR